jgi:UPF0755 protein
MLQPEAAPPPPVGPPPSKRRPTLSALSGFFSFLLLVAVGLVTLLGYSQHEIRSPGPLQSDKVVLIAPRTEVQEIIAQLESEGVIANSLFMNGALITSGNRSKVRAGEYLFKAHASIQDVIDTLVSGREIMHSITVPEGLTSEQIIQRLRENDLLTGDVREIPKEGSLLPETYRVARGMSRGDLVRKMQDDQKKALEQIWGRRSADIPLRSPYEMLTLASIVEKETGRADERPRVAGVFINRLQKRMKLQSDPTIVYGIVGGKGTLGRGILRSEVEKPTPYNTYAIEGLPPGPIANPGRAALEAVANPSRTKDLYFVADGTGGHAFAETIDQHNKNVVRWRQLEKDAKERANNAGTPAPAVDHFVPDPGPAAPGPILRDQRGDLEGPIDPVFGGLSPALGRATADALAFSAPTAAVVAPAYSAIETSSKKATEPPRQTQLAIAPVPARDPAPSAPAAGTAPKPLTMLSLGGGFDQSLAAQLGMASEALDGPDEPAGDVTDPGSYPVSPQRRAEQKSRAARFGVNPGDDSLPTEVATLDRDRTPPPEAATGPKVIRVYDASEGTALDPLKDKTWDLNSPKNVPLLESGQIVQRKPAPAAKPKPVKAASDRGARTGALEPRPSGN